METPREREGRVGRRLPTYRGTLTLEQVTYRYSPLAPPAVCDVSLEIQPSKMVAIVGSSGSGKSTLASLLAGLLVPDSGRILFDGIDIAELDLPWLRSQMGYVPQATYLFGASIRSNITLTHRNLPLHRVVEAAKLACIDDDVSSLPMGYETLLADGGASMSGGQQQRIALARALVHRPKGSRKNNSSTEGVKAPLSQGARARHTRGLSQGA